jgi:hypothetical protein
MPPSRKKNRSKSKSKSAKSLPLAAVHFYALKFGLSDAEARAELLTMTAESIRGAAQEARWWREMMKGPEVIEVSGGGDGCPDWKGSYSSNACWDSLPDEEKKKFPAIRKKIWDGMQPKELDESDKELIKNAAKAYLNYDDDDDDE